MSFYYEGHVSLNESIMRKIISLLLSCFCLSVSADEPKTQLVVWAKDGTKVAYALAEKPKVTFTATDLVVASNGLEVNYTLAEMARFTYESDAPTAITNLNNGKTSMSLDGESLLFPALTEGSTVAIYDMGGKTILSKSITATGEYSFPLSSLNAGVYMVSVNGLTYKIVKK